MFVRMAVRVGSDVVENIRALTLLRNGGGRALHGGEGEAAQKVISFRHRHGCGRVHVVAVISIPWIS